MPSLLVTAAEMRALDRAVIEEVGVPGVVLMESAGRGVVEVVAALVDTTRARVVVYAGGGNNGGDGFVIARHLANRGATVDVILCAPAGKVTGDAHTHLYACKRSGVTILDGTSEAALADAAARTQSAALVIDALFGTGLQRELTGHWARAVELINAHAGIKVAVDLPSGLESDRGVPLGACVRADHTVTFAFCKRGLATAPGFTWAGRVHVADIGIPESLARARGVASELLDDGVLAPLRSLDPLGHKGTHGHLLVVAGSPGKVGAALLCGRAALRAGAGLCTVAAPPAAQARMEGLVPELMTVAYERFEALAPLLAGKRAVAVGPGMPTDEAARELLRKLVAAAGAAGLPIVLDADALNHLAADPTILDGATPAEGVVLTPHPGEAARLAGRSTVEVQADRIACAESLARRFAAVVALKGARTVVAAPDGRLAICPTGNPGLGTGGSGDVLTGCVGALLARGLDPYAATTAAVYLHGAAGDLVASTQGPQGFLAGDVSDALPRVLSIL